MSFMKASIRGGFAELHPMSAAIGRQRRGGNSHLNNTIIGAYIQYLSAKLMRQMRDGIQMLILVSQRLTGRQSIRMIIGVGSSALLPWCLRIRRLRHFLELRSVRRGHLPVMSHEVFEILRAQDRNLREQQFPLDEGRGRVVQHRPHGDQILQLPTGLLYHPVLAGQHDCHAGQIFHFRVADDQAVNVEPPCRQDTGDARQDAGLILHEAIEYVPFWRERRGQGRFVENRGYSSRGGP